jgi:hypothetical protein
MFLPKQQATGGSILLKKVKKDQSGLQPLLNVDLAMSIYLRPNFNRYFLDLSRCLQKRSSGSDEFHVNTCA